MTEEITIQDKEILREAIKDPVASIRDLTKNSLYFFILHFWECYSDETFISNWHIEKICKELEYVARRVGNKLLKKHDLLFNVPPGTTKTAVVSIFFPVWCWINWHWMRFITSSHTDTLSLESAEYSRDIIRHEDFQKIFPDLRVKQDKDQKSNFRVEKLLNGKWKRGGNRLSTSVGSKVATGFHAHIIIPDDLVDPKAAVSKVKLEEADKHMDQILSTRKVDKAITVTIMIAQRLSPNDPSGHWLAKGKKNIKHYSLPGEIANYKEYLKPAKFEKYYKDQLMDTRRMPWSVLDEMMEDLGQYGFAGQVGQNPIMAGGGMFDVDQISIVDRIPATVTIDKIVRYWDKAATDGGGAHTAGVKMAKLDNKCYLVMDVRRGQWATDKREDIIKATAEADGREEEVHIYIEQEPGSGGKDSAISTIDNLDGFAIEADRPTGNKVFRADPFSVKVNRGKLWLLRGDWNKAYIDELRLFPNGTFKDQTDASSGAYTKLRILKEVKVYER